MGLKNQATNAIASSLKGWALVPPVATSLLLITLLPVLLNTKLCFEFWQGSRAQAWDGSGHYALAQIYDQSIFPETFLRHEISRDAFVYDENKAEQRERIDQVWVGPAECV